MAGVPRVLFDGFLSKQSPHVLKGWQRRHFTLTSDSYLTYRKAPGSTEESGRIRLDPTSLVARRGGEGSLEFEITVREDPKVPERGVRSFRLRAPDEEELDIWIRYLLDAKSQQGLKNTPARADITSSPRVASRVESGTRSKSNKDLTSLPAFHKAPMEVRQPVESIFAHADGSVEQLESAQVLCDLARAGQGHEVDNILGNAELAPLVLPTLSRLFRASSETAIIAAETLYYLCGSSSMGSAVLRESYRHSDDETDTLPTSMTEEVLDLAKLWDFDRGSLQAALASCNEIPESPVGLWLSKAVRRLVAGEDTKLDLVAQGVVSVLVAFAGRTTDTSAFEEACRAILAITSGESLVADETIVNAAVIHVVRQAQATAVLGWPGDTRRSMIALILIDLLHAVDVYQRAQQRDSDALRLGTWPQDDAFHWESFRLGVEVLEHGGLPMIMGTVRTHPEYHGRLLSALLALVRGDPDQLVNIAAVRVPPGSDISAVSAVLDLLVAPSSSFETRKRASSFLQLLAQFVADDPRHHARLFELGVVDALAKVLESDGAYCETQIKVLRTLAAFATSGCGAHLATVPRVLEAVMALAGDGGIAGRVSTRFSLSIEGIEETAQEFSKELLELICEAEGARANLTTFYHNGPRRRNVTADAVMHLIRLRPSLTELRVPDTQLGAESLAEAVDKCPSIRALSLPRSVTPAGVLVSVPRLREVEYLAVKGIPLRAVDVEGRPVDICEIAVCESPFAGRLSTLDVSLCGLDDTQLSSICRHCPSLVRLVLAGNTGLTDPSPLAGLEKLSRLNVRGTGLTSMAAALVAAWVADVPSLKTIKMAAPVETERVVRDALPSVHVDNAVLQA